MTFRSKFKDLIRIRMAITGEKYTQARAVLVRERDELFGAIADAPPLAEAEEKARKKAGRK